MRKSQTGVNSYTNIWTWCLMRHLPVRHIDYVCKNVSKRLGILKLIKHLLPMATRELFIKTMILPIIDYEDIVWGDKSNMTLMNPIQVLQNKASKLILDKPEHSSATESLQQLGWNNMYQRRRYIIDQFLYIRV